MLASCTGIDSIPRSPPLESYNKAPLHHHHFFFSPKQVLESIVGHNILPRGTGIVTRVPLVLQLHAPTEAELTAALADPSNPEGAKEEWGEFTHLVADENGAGAQQQGRRRFFDFDEVRRTIEARTAELAGDNKGVVNKPIHLKVTSPRLLELTLVDLPGFTKMPVGDQPDDIHAQIRAMCLDYVRNPNTIVLAITAANTDLSNSDALQVAKEVDPQGNRTVGVLTKVDLMDRGTDCSDVLLNRVIPLKLGFVAVVNRGQQDVNDCVDVRTALAREEDFFAQHPAYSSSGGGGSASALSAVKTKALRGKLGTGALVEKLSQNLVATIRGCLPGLRTRLTNMLQDTAAERSALGEPIEAMMMMKGRGGSHRTASSSNNGSDGDVVIDEGRKRDALKRLCLDSTTAFALRFRQSLDGTVDTMDAVTAASSAMATATGGIEGGDRAHMHMHMPMHMQHGDELLLSEGGVQETGAAAITRIFEEQFLASIEAIDALDGLSDDYVRRVIENTQSFPPSLFVPEKAFHALVKEQIARLEQPGAQCVDLVHDKLLAIASQCLLLSSSNSNSSSGSGMGGGGGGSAGRFPKFVNRIDELVAAECKPLAERCKGKVRDMIDWELGYINTKHPDFVDFKEVASMLFNKKKATNSNDDGATAAGESDGTSSSSSTASEARGASRERSGSESRRQQQQQQQQQQREEDEGPFWRGWFGGGGNNSNSNSSNSSNEQPRPRRGGRRSSFGIMDPSELEKFRASQQFASVAEAMASEGRPSTDANMPPPPPASVIAQCRDPTTLNDKDLQVFVVQQLIRSYFDIVARDFCDKVPKAIMATVVNSVKENLQNELITALYDDEVSVFRELMCHRGVNSTAKQATEMNFCLLTSK